MKVIKEGKDLSPSKRITCNKCGCVFEYEYSDIKLEEGDGIFGQYHYVVCPNKSCNQMFKVNKFR